MRGDYCFSYSGELIAAGKIPGDGKKEEGFECADAADVALFFTCVGGWSGGGGKTPGNLFCDVCFDDARSGGDSLFMWVTLFLFTVVAIARVFLSGGG